MEVRTFVVKRGRKSPEWSNPAAAGQFAPGSSVSRILSAGCEICAASARKYLQRRVKCGAMKAHRVYTALLRGFPAQLACGRLIEV